MSERREPLSYRNNRHVATVIGIIYDSDRPVTDDEVADDTTAWPWSTTARILRELADFGAIRHITPIHGQRAWKATTLGVAWLDREVGPWPWPTDEDDTSG